MKPVSYTHLDVYKRQTAARLVAKEGTYCHIELPSGELRLIHGECMATVGEVGNSEHNLVNLGKAGRCV